MSKPSQVEAIFFDALEQKTAEDRAAYLESACGDDVELRRQVEKMLAAHPKVGDFLDRPVAEQLAAPDATQELESSTDGESSAESDRREPSMTRTHDGQIENDDDGLSFLEPSTRPDSLGRLGHYEVLEVLGKGGFGIVLRAFDDVLQRVVALKVLAPAIAATSPARKRFLREAQSSAKVRHENVVQVYGVEEKPLPYLVMEFIPGETLQQRLDRIGPLDLAETVRIGRQIAEGLAAAHATDLIHRDIKPGNVLIEKGPQERVKITDFGLARAADDASLTRSGVVAGTPMYMSPEQAKGDSFDHRADLFSLGSVMYVMCTGRPPFRASTTYAVLKRVADDEPRPIREVIPEVPEWLCRIVEKLHAKNPDDRFQTAREVADLLADCEAKLKAQQEVKDILPAPTVKPTPPSEPAAATVSPAPAAEWMKWVAAAAIILLPVVALAVTELAGVTHLFRGQQPTPDPIKPGGDPLPVLLAKKEQLPLGGGWMPLFNGKNLTGWKTPARADAWQVEEELLVGRGAGGEAYLFSERHDWNLFHLRVEAKINAAGDSGVFFRTGPGENGAAPVLGYEAHIGGADHPRPTGSLFQQKPLATAPPNTIKPGEWFTLDVLVQGREVTFKLNGKNVMKHVLDDEKSPHGQLALQVWGPDTVVHFKRIEIRELAPLPIAKQEPQPPTFKNSIGMEFVIVPKGKSWLGGYELQWGDKEVVIPADFYLGKYEVTQEEWTQVMAKNPSHFSRNGEGKDSVKDISDADLKRFPVESVSWDQCQIFVAKLNKLEKETGWVYRLPKEAEWEYACRGGPMADKLDSAFDFYFAKPTNTLLPEQANFKDNGLKRPRTVGSYEANRLGLFDMHGNVWEWCEDAVNANDAASPRVDRGGSWHHDSGYSRAAVRDTGEPSEWSHSIGVRLARVPAGAPSPEVKTPPLAVAPFTDADVKRIAALPAAEQIAEVRKELKKRNPGFDGALTPTIKNDHPRCRRVASAQDAPDHQRQARGAVLEGRPSQASGIQGVAQTGSRADCQAAGGRGGRQVQRTQPRL